MRLFSTIFLALILFATSLNAQLFTDFTAEDGYDKAFSIADSSMDNPKLKLIASIVDEVDLGVPFGLTKFNIDLETGKATTWAYSFAEASDSTNVVHVIIADVAPLGGKMNLLEFDDSLGDNIDEWAPNGFLNTDENAWIGSMDFFDKILSDSSYQTLAGKFPDAQVSVVALANNEVNILFSIDEPYWNANFGENDEFTCVTHALTGVTTCYEPLVESVINLGNYAGFNLYPQPANQGLTLIIPDELWSNDSKLFIYDVNGQIVQQLTSPRRAGEFFIPLVGINSGVYFIKYQTSENVFSIKFTKE